MIIYREQGRSSGWRRRSCTTTTCRDCFYFDICGEEPDSPTTQGKHRCICHLLAILKSFSLAWCIRWQELCAKTIDAFPSLENWLPFLDHLFYENVFLMLSLALEKQMFVLTKNDASSGMGCYQKYNWMVDRSWPWWVQHRKRCTSDRYQTLGWNDKAETGRVTCMRRESRCSVSVCVD